MPLTISCGRTPRQLPMDLSEIWLTFHREGLADELLAKREEERGRKRDEDAQGLPLRRPRSESVHSMSSVSTISTNRSHSRSPPRHSRGRDRGGSVSSHHSKTKKRRYSDSSPGSVSSYSSGERARSHSREWARDRNTRRRRRESSPGERGRRVNSSQDRGRRYRSRTRSMDRDQIAKDRRSMTPETLHGRDYPTRRPRGSMSPPEPSHSRSENAHSRRPRHETNNPALQPRRERSLSPYSKRLVLTQAMNVGR